MSRYQANGATSWSERKRLMRFRRQREHLRFSEELKLVPRVLVWGMLALYAVLQSVALYMCSNDIPERWSVADNAPMKVQLTVVALAGLGIAIPVFCVVLLAGYVYRDAGRRGMNAPLWVFLVLVLLPAYLLVGFVMYFVAREPLPYHCPKCGTMVSARFNYCPGCKYELNRTCASCQGEVGDMDKYCPHCGNDVAPSVALERA
jgi:hypothetical protein